MMVIVGLVEATHAIYRTSISAMQSSCNSLFLQLEICSCSADVKLSCVAAAIRVWILASMAS